MKLFFDARYIKTDFHDGISRYSAELGVALSKLVPVTFLICDKAQLKLLPENAVSILIHAPTSPMEPLTALILNRYHPDVVFSPMQTMGSLGRRFKLILTLHDMIYYRHRTPPRHLRPLIRVGWRAYHATYLPQRLTLNRADLIVTVSQTSKDDIVRTRLTNRPVVIVPNAPQQLRALLSHDVTITKQPKNLAYMGSFMPYKNVETLIRGMEFLTGYTLHLLSRISPKRKRQLESLIPAGAKVVFHGGVSDKVYAKLLADNALLVSASFDEGFGLPLAEALKLGVPAVVSDLPIHHEVAGDGVLYFDPRSARDFAKKIASIDAMAAAKLGTAGQQYISKYNWQASATILYEAASELTKNTPK